VARDQQRPLRRRSLRRWAVDMALIAACVASLLAEPAWLAAHSILGLLFAGAVGPHLWHRRAWIRGALRRARQRRPLSRAVRWRLPQAAALLVLTVVVTATGLVNWLDPRAGIGGHGIASVVLLGFLARHAWTRRRFLLPVRRGRWPATGPGRPR
jgi:hypothetical protein